MTRIGKRSFIFATVLVGALTGCGGSSSSTPTTALVADVVVIAKNGIRLDQSSYSALTGDISIAYVDEDSIRHTLVIVKDGSEVAGFELKVNKKGDVDQATVNLEPGTYTLMCTVPGHQNMEASFTVK
jgi:plastocyanin